MNPYGFNQVIHTLADERKMRAKSQITFVTFPSKTILKETKYMLHSPLRMNWTNIHSYKSLQPNPVLLRHRPILALGSVDVSKSGFTGFVAISSAFKVGQLIIADFFADLISKFLDFLKENGLWDSDSCKHFCGKGFYYQISEDSNVTGHLFAWFSFL